MSKPLKLIIYLSIGILLPIIGIAWHSDLWFTLPGGWIHPLDHHQMISEKAYQLGEVDNFELNYPDIIKFRQPIIDAGEGTLDDAANFWSAHHIGVGENVEGFINVCDKENYSCLCKFKWDKKILGITGEYTRAHFGGAGSPIPGITPVPPFGAYYYIGQIFHLTQDMAVPAHAFYIPHGRVISEPPVLTDHHKEHLQDGGTNIFYNPNTKHKYHFEFGADDIVEGNYHLRSGGQTFWVCCPNRSHSIE